MLMFLNGTAMSGQADHGQLQGSTLLRAARTSAGYRFYAVRGEFPGLVPVDEGGGCVEGELYELPESVWEQSLAPSEPVELALGQVQLDDGETVFAMLLDTSRVDPADITDITELGGWRAYLRSIGAVTPSSRTS